MIKITSIDLPTCVGDRAYQLGKNKNGDISIITTCQFDNTLGLHFTALAYQYN